MLVPAARNLHWRYAVLHSAFITCKQRLAPSSDLQKNLDELLKATAYIWDRISKNSVTIKGAVKPINGRLEILFQDDNVDGLAKLILKSYLDTTRYIAGCQAIRQKIGHILFGFRVVYGEVIFVTVSPNRRHSALLLKLPRARANDTMLQRQDQAFKFRSRMCGSDNQNSCRVSASTCVLMDRKPQLKLNFLHCWLVKVGMHRIH